MSNYYCRMALYSGYQNELMHTGKLGMHWGIRRYQPYSIGYQSQNGGIYVGPKIGLFGSKAKAIFGKAKKGYDDAADVIAGFGKEFGKRAGDRISYGLTYAGAFTREFGKLTLNAAKEKGRESIARGRDYLSAFANTDAGRDIVSALSAYGKYGKGLLKSGSEKARYGADYTRGFIGSLLGKKQRNESMEEYQRTPKYYESDTGFRNPSVSRPGQSKEDAWRERTSQQSFRSAKEAYERDMGVPYVPNAVETVRKAVQKAYAGGKPASERSFSYSAYNMLSDMVETGAITSPAIKQLLSSFESKNGTAALKKWADKPENRGTFRLPDEDESIWF